VLDGLVDEAARDLQARVTIVAPNGAVLADSGLPVEALAAVENHKDRPEVRAALGGEVGRASRRSTTLGEPMLYVAVPIRLDGWTHGVARVATSLRGIEAEMGRRRNAVIAALLLATALAAALGYLANARFNRALRAVTSGAREFARGNLGARILPERQDELGDLARHLNQMANTLDERLSETAGEKRRTEAILQAMEEGLLAVDTRGTVVLANEALIQGLGLQHPVGRHYIESVRQREIDDVVTRVLAFGQRETAEFELAARKRSYAVTGMPLLDANGTPHGAIVTFHDITTARRVESVRRDFVANASHELRTPLTSIRGFVEALEDGAMNEPATAERFLGKIRVHADRMAELIEDLLELSRLESGADAIGFEPVSPARLAGAVVAAFAERAAAKSIDLAVRKQADVTVLSDAERLRRILENLVDNAVKYTPEGGSVEVTVQERAGGGARIEVRDTGPGIPAEHLPRIFERFYRVDKSRSRELGGTGLGLSIVKHLAESLGASVSVLSEVGAGTCFAIDLPRR
jgi:two-component system phosphate regulon sensor histidine kinase PhoR